jgi:iron donor protein CyaY
MLDEYEFRRHCDAALDDLFKALNRATEEHDLDPDMVNGALQIAFDSPPGKFVVSPQTPVRQVWVSAHSRSFKFDWVPARQAFILPETGETLKQMIGGAISTHLGELVTL